MKKNILILMSLFATSNIMAQEIDYSLEKTQEALDFAEYMGQKPDEIILFETTTREIDFNSKKAWIMDVGVLNPSGVFETRNYAEIEKFVLDFSAIQLTESFNNDTYPQKRIQSECLFKTEEYGLFVEGKFLEDGVFKASKIKTKLIGENSDNTCQRYY